MTASMILFWTLVIFGAIVLVHYLGRENRPAVGRSEPTAPAVPVHLRVHRSGRSRLVHDPVGLLPERRPLQLVAGAREDGAEHQAVPAS